jgi:hypothetical protein
MTKQEILQMIERNMRNHPNPMIDTETALEALQKVLSSSRTPETKWALVGGVAMHLYGSPRLTKDIDVIASAVLPLKAERSLGFGGARYRVKVGKKNVPVDWIVRNDTARKFYEQALKEAGELFGIRVVKPEWLIILKYIAGRFKDQQDAVFLLKQKGLVKRRLIRQKIIETAGSEFWALVAVGLQRWYDLADGRITTEKEDYEAERL